ncbi:hypothetical protein UlMin_032819 [Ulmus minor]
MERKNETSPELSSKRHKRLNFCNSPSIQNLLNGLDSGRFGSAAKDIEALLSRNKLSFQTFMKNCSTEKHDAVIDLMDDSEEVNQNRTNPGHDNLNNLEDDFGKNEAKKKPFIIIDSDEEGEVDQRPLNPAYEAFHDKEKVTDIVDSGAAEEDATLSRKADSEKDCKDVDVGAEDDGLKKIPVELIRASFKSEANFEMKKDEGVSDGTEDDDSEDNGTEHADDGAYIGVEDGDNYQITAVDDDLGDIWDEMSMAVELSKRPSAASSSKKLVSVDEESCQHLFDLKDDIGEVCRVCGLIGRGIDTIFEFHYIKYKSTRTYMPESRNSKYNDSNGLAGHNLSGEDLMVDEVYAHPRHSKQMKPHQVEGFNFLVRNLVGDNPNGCILAHAPGSGKTFMLISFVQSFLAKYPNARPLVVLPKGILETWKKEFLIWQVEDIPLYDFYSTKADNSLQRLEVLNQWIEKKSILFLGYQQFATIITDVAGTNKVSTSCQEKLLKIPSLLILDEGHTPRNEETNILQALAMVETRRKVVLSGTLFQNHVKEVFNILNLVYPKFLRMESSQCFVKRIMSKGDLVSVRKNVKGYDYAAFYDLVEHTFLNDTDFRRKASVVEDLREMTRKVLHYHKGDLADLPGLVDFTVVLSLSSKQKHEAENIKKMLHKFKANSVGSAVFLHPKLLTFANNPSSSDDKLTDQKIDEMLKNLDINEGVKAKFFLHMLSLCDATKEKLLVFSQYLLPLRFLERLAVKEKGWALGREMFMISGDSSFGQRKSNMEMFNNSPEAKIFFGSIKACGEGISLVGGSRILFLDVHLNPSVTRQAIGRAFRPGQTKIVYAYRLIAADTPEEEDHEICFKKELISKLWFEWNQCFGHRDFEMKTVDVANCDDPFFESPLLTEDIKVLYRR